MKHWMGEVMVNTGYSRWGKMTEWPVYNPLVKDLASQPVNSAPITLHNIVRAFGLTCARNWIHNGGEHIHRCQLLGSFGWLIAIETLQPHPAVTVELNVPNEDHEQGPSCHSWAKFFLMRPMSDVPQQKGDDQLEAPSLAIVELQLHCNINLVAALSR